MTVLVASAVSAAAVSLTLTIIIARRDAETARRAGLFHGRTGEGGTRT